MPRLDTYTVEVRRALTFAREEAWRLRHRSVGTEHLLLGLLKLKDPLIDALFVSLQTSSQCIAQAVELLAKPGNKALLGRPSFNVSARATLVRAEQEASAVHAKLVGSEHIFLAICTECDGIIVSVLEKFGLFPDVVRRLFVSLLNDGREKVLCYAQFQTLYEATPVLNLCSHDLTMAALNGILEPLIGREAELERVMQVLLRRSKNHPLLIGPAGVGKTAIVEGLAQRIIQGRVPDDLRYCRIVALDDSRGFVNGELMKGRLVNGPPTDNWVCGDFEERLQYIVQEMANQHGVILVLDEFYSLIHAGIAEGLLAMSHLFKALLARDEFQCIGVATPDEYRRMITTAPALGRYFQPVWVAETNPQETLEILYGLRSHYENFHQITISDEALAKAVQMSSRYIPNCFQPGKAIDLVDEAASLVRVQRSTPPFHVYQLRDEIVMVEREKNVAIARHDFVQANRLLKYELQLCQMLRQRENDWKVRQIQERALLKEQDIAVAVATRTGIPVVQPDYEEAQRLLKIEDELHQRVVGQHEAVQAVAKVVRRLRAGMHDNRRPIGSFLFAGPTGVGKTELARALAITLFGSENALFRIEMSVLMDSQYVSHLIGAPMGYIGYEQAGQLTEAVRRCPYSLVLFDGIENAHPGILDLLLQILEDGCLTDSHGQVIDFRHTIIILTANVGTTALSRGFLPGQQSKQRNLECRCDEIMSVLKGLFKPELFNRIDDMILFHALEQKHLYEIVDLMVEQMVRLLAKQSIELQVTSVARLILTEQCCDSESGVRLLRRNMQRLLGDMLADLILQGKIVAGDLVIADVIEGRLTTKVLLPEERNTRADDQKQAVA